MGNRVVGRELGSGIVQDVSMSLGKEREGYSFAGDSWSSCRFGRVRDGETQNDGSLAGGALWKFLGTRCHFWTTQF